VKKAIIIFSLLSSVASARQHVTCDIGLKIMFQGKQNHVNLSDVRGVLLNDDGDKWHVDFKNSLPSEYTYLEGPDLWVSSNSCVYEKTPETYDGE
jgi:hypothetical protein